MVEAVRGLRVESQIAAFNKNADDLVVWSSNYNQL